MQDLIVKDEEFSGYSNRIAGLSDSIEYTYQGVIKQLRRACEEGVTDGAFHDNLLAFIGSLEIMQGQLQYITNAMQRNANEFVEQIDAIDGDIY